MRLNGVWPDLPIRLVCSSSASRSTLPRSRSRRLTAPRTAPPAPARPSTGPPDDRRLGVPCRWAPPLWRDVGRHLLADVAALWAARLRPRCRLPGDRHPGDARAARAWVRPPPAPAPLARPPSPSSVPPVPFPPLLLQEALRGPYRPTPLVPPRAPQAAGALPCYGILLTITVTGITFLLNLVRFLDGDASVSFDVIIDRSSEATRRCSASTSPSSSCRG